MDYELIVAVLVEAFEAAAVAADAMHARRRVAGEFDPFRVERVELRVDDRSRKWNHLPAAAVDAAGGDAGLAVLFNGRRKPLSAGAQRDLAKLGAGEV
ncbi:MAG: hypothetical protein HUU37_07920, partial [Bdellovibrionales bacterium]|nr:hypothetical protein [Bdellovibrionales bacterium]